MGSNVTDTLVVVMGKKNGIGIFAYKQRLLSIQKFVKHVPRINERERERTRFPALVCRSDILAGNYDI